ncbi:MAG TPA: hypothetical protein VFU21_04520 [Kofleriaceae bacterium]|nr:hypothetical protein [Kofleriaceae bacterium]
MTPYRTSGASRSVRPEPEPGPDDDPVILWLALVVSLLGLVPRLLVRGSWGAEPTLALLVAGASGTLLVRRAFRSRREKRP